MEKQSYSNKGVRVKTTEELIQETHDTVLTLTAVLLGAKGSSDTGLCGEVECLKKEVSTLKSKYSKLQTILFVLSAVLGVTGTLSGINLFGS